MKEILSTIITVFLALSVSNLYVVRAQECPTAGREAGLQVKIRDYVYIPAAADRAYIMLQKGGINCYGVIKEWELFQENGTSCSTIKLQIWRKSTTAVNQYILVGYNNFTCDPTAIGTINVRIPENKQVAVSPGDIIGWTVQTVGDVGLYYDNVTLSCTNSVCGQVLLIDGCLQTVGGSCDWTGSDIQFDFSIKALVYKLPSPTFSNLPSEVTVQETTNNISTLFTVSGLQFSNTVNAQGNAMTDVAPVVFSLGSNTDVFTIDTTTGDISTVTALNYESVSQYNLMVKISALESTTTSTLTVKVSNLNELHSVNLPSSISISVSSIVANTEVFKVIASDVDNPTSSINFYFTSATPSDPQPFAIDSSTGSIYTTVSLVDWTGPTEYNLSIQATDYTQTAGPQVLKITLTDLKAKPTILYLANYVKITIPEDAPTGSNIYQLRGVGPDFSELEYSLTGVEPTSGSSYFSVNSVDGVVSVSSGANFNVSVQDVYILNVTVKDSRYTSDVYPLMVQLDWRNRGPEFDQTVYKLTMKENSTQILPLVNIIVYDRDVNYSLPIAAPDATTCYILPGIGAEFFVLPDCQNFYATGVIDIDTHSEYVTLNLTIMVNDTSGYSDTASVIIEVEDQNDNSPTFASTSYTASVAENTPGGISLLTALASDKDYTSANSMVTYSIRNINSNNLGSLYFQINSSTGLISTKQPVNYEAYTAVDFEVVATDSGSPALSSSATVRITITDLNDNRPTFVCTNKVDSDYYISGDECFYNLEVRSDSLTGYTIMTITATDADTVTRTLSYYLLRPETHWSLSSGSGALSVNQALDDDREYILYCYARDNGEPELLSGPLVARVDSYEPWRYLIDITLDIPVSSFNQTSIQDLFLTNLRNLLFPWVVKTESYQLEKDRTVVTIYAFDGNSTFKFSNLDAKKEFIWRYDMLGKLRKDIYGNPSDGLLGADFTVFKPIKVMPTFIIWWIDTVEGIATICVLVFVFIVIVITTIVCICRKCKYCCFREKGIFVEYTPPDSDVIMKPLAESDEHSLRYRTNGSAAKRRVSIESLHGDFGLRY